MKPRTLHEDYLETKLTLEEPTDVSAILMDRLAAARGSIGGRDIDPILPPGKYRVKITVGIEKDEA